MVDITAVVCVGDKTVALKEGREGKEGKTKDNLDTRARNRTYLLTCCSSSDSGVDTVHQDKNTVSLMCMHAYVCVHVCVWVCEVVAGASERCTVGRKMRFTTSG